MKSPVYTAAAAALLFGASQTAHADASLGYQYADGKPAAEVHVSGEKVRMERSGDGFAMLADTGTGTLTMIDHRKRTYTVMDRAAITAMNAQMKQMQQAMQAQLANLSEEQRAALEKQMPGMAGAGGMAPEPTVRTTADKRSIGGRGCEVVEMVMGGRTMYTACVAPAASLGLSAQDTATLQALATLLVEMGRGGGGQMPAMVRNGIPLETTNPHSGQPETLQSVDKGKLDAALFAVPTGYREQPMPAHTTRPP